MPPSGKAERRLAPQNNGPVRGDSGDKSRQNVAVHNFAQGVRAGGQSKVLARRARRVNLALHRHNRGHRRPATLSKPGLIGC